MRDLHEYAVFCIIDLTELADFRGQCLVEITGKWSDTAETANDTIGYTGLAAPSNHQTIPATPARCRKIVMPSRVRNGSLRVL